MKASSGPSAAGTPRTHAAAPGLKHALLRDALADLVTTQLAPDAPIPSERDLMVEHGVSRATVRKAIDQLVADGLLRRVHGKGTFVTRPRLESDLHLASFSQDMRRRGWEPSTELLALEAERPPADAAASLRLGPDDLAWRLERVRLADGQPIAHEEGWMPHALLPDLHRHDLGESLYALMSAQYGITIDAAEQTLWGEAADAAMAQRLRTEVTTPLLVFRRISSAAGIPVEHVVSRYRGDRYQLHMSLGTTPNPSTDEGNPS